MGTTENNTGTTTRPSLHGSQLKLTRVLFDVDPYFEACFFHSVSYLEHRGLGRPVVTDEYVSIVLYRYITCRLCSFSQPVKQLKETKDKAHSTLPLT